MQDNKTTCLAEELAKSTTRAIVPITEQHGDRVLAGVSWATTVQGAIVGGKILIPIADGLQAKNAFDTARNQVQTLLESLPVDASAAPRAITTTAPAPTRPPAEPSPAPKPIGRPPTKPKAAKKDETKPIIPPGAPPSAMPPREEEEEGEESPVNPADQGEPGDPDNDPGGPGDFDPEDEMAGDHVIHYTQKHKGKKLKDSSRAVVQYFATTMTADDPSSQTLTAKGVALKEAAQRYLRFLDSQ